VNEAKEFSCDKVGEISVPKHPGRPHGFVAACRPGPASILKACAKGGTARLGSEAARPAARPARDLKSLHPPA